MPERDETLKMWQGRAELARRFLDEHGNTDKRWDKNVKAMAGDYNSLSELGDEAIDVNLVRSTIKSTLPPIWMTEPHITVTPTRKTYKGRDNIQAAEITELEINYWIEELAVREVVKQVVHDAEAMNLGYIYTGYTKKASDLEDPAGNRLEPNPLIKARQPFVIRMSPKHVLVPPGYFNLEDMPWIDLVFLRPLSAVESKFGEERTEDIPTVDMHEIEEHDIPQPFREFMESDEAKFVEVHNVWDKETKRIYVFAKDHDMFLDDPKPWPIEVEGFPVEMYRPELVPEEFFGTPPISYYLPQVKELNATRTAMRKRRGRTKAVVWMDSELAQEAGERYKVAKDGEIIPVQLAGEPIAGKIVTDPGLPFDQGDLMYDSVIKADVREQSVGAERRGSGDPNVSSATASANIEKGTQIREADRADGVRKLYIGIARKLWMILRQFPDEERERLIVGENRSPFTVVKYSLRELAGEFAFNMDLGAALSDTPQARATQAILNYNLMRADPLVDPSRLILDVFRSQNKVDPAGYMLTLREPDEEFQMFLQGLPVEAHERDAHVDHLRGHNAQGQQLDDALGNIEEGPARQKLALAQALLVAHVQDHFRKAQQAGGPEAGKAIAENLLRNQVRAGGGEETQAELTGQPLSPANLVR